MALLLLIVIGVLLLVTVMFVPTIVAFRRQHPNRWPIFVINVVFGGTGLGWLVALIWALQAVHRPADPTLSRGGVSGLNLFIDDERPVRLAPAAASRLSGPARDTGWAVEQIERLNRMRDAGHLTAEEHGALRAEVMRAVGG